MANKKLSHGEAKAIMKMCFRYKCDESVDKLPFFKWIYFDSCITIEPGAAGRRPDISLCLGCRSLRCCGGSSVGPIRSCYEPICLHLNFSPRQILGGWIAARERAQNQRGWKLLQGQSRVRTYVHTAPRNNLRCPKTCCRLIIWDNRITLPAF